MQCLVLSPPTMPQDTYRDRHDLLAFSSYCRRLPFLMVAGPARWISFGPFAVQASRIGFSGIYSLAGGWASHHGSQRVAAAIEKASAWRWPLLAGLLYIGFVGTQIARWIGWFDLCPVAWLALYGVYTVLFCGSEYRLACDYVAIRPAAVRIRR
jgi:glucan biosynthesis protein C